MLAASVYMASSQVSQLTKEAAPPPAVTKDDTPALKQPASARRPPQQIAESGYWRDDREDGWLIFDQDTAKDPVDRRRLWPVTRLSSAWNPLINQNRPEFVRGFYDREFYQLDQGYGAQFDQLKLVLRQRRP